LAAKFKKSSESQNSTMRRRGSDTACSLKEKKQRTSIRILRFVLPAIWVVFVIVQSLASWTNDTAASVIRVPYVANKAQSRLSSAPDTDDCIRCHFGEHLKGKLEDLTVLPLSINWDEYERSIHGLSGLDCLACHFSLDADEHRQQALRDYPECYQLDGGSILVGCSSLLVEMPYAEPRVFTLEINTACASCHEEQDTIALDNVHLRMLQQGNLFAPICVDCHGSHAITPVGDPRSQITSICASCHRAVYSSYRASVHGEALEIVANLDVPTCIDCHGVHDIQGPRDVSFRNDSVYICGGCHGDEELMDKYDISADVFSTYLSDIHGRVNLTVQLNQDLDSNKKPVCFDCHGIHNIQSTDNPLSAVSEENIKTTCMQCHDDVASQFPRIWLSHFPPNLDKHTGWAITFWVVRIVIPVGLGGYLLFIAWVEGARWWTKRQTKIGS
jgi:nitrate/TMAO reductase-like tetraheme cytochrome c subunit